MRFTQHSVEETKEQIKTIEEQKQKLAAEGQQKCEQLETEIKSLTASISRANSETMHYKRDLEAIKLEFSTVTQMLLTSDEPKTVQK